MKRIDAPIRIAALAASMFVAGAAAGFTYSCSTQRKPADADSRIELVKGSAVDVAADSADAITVDPSQPPTTPGNSQGATPKLSPQAIATEALRYSVFVRGKGVYGSGMLVGSSGYVLTCWHVIEGVKEIHVALPNEGLTLAELVDHDSRLDLAVLKIGQPRAVEPRLGSVADIQVGDDVFGMGAPRRMTFSLSRGMVSYVGRTFDGVHFIQTDLPINVGSSGGPVLNAQGEVIGISTFVLKDSEGLAFAVPIDYAYRRFSAIFGKHSANAFDGWLARRAVSTTKL